MDAICLALYGETPRLGKITHSSNEIMSRHTGECVAEIIFETHKSKYKCIWSQHRAGKKPDGSLQPPKHELSKYPSNEIIESQLKKTREKIDEITGLDFKRFNRSIMLSQGSFAAFLQSSEKDKSEILEQITGTEIYSKISQKVNDIRSIAKSEKEKVQLQIDSTQLLNDEEITNVKIEKTQFQDKIQLLTPQQIEIDKKILIIETIEKLKSEIKIISQNILDFEIQQKKHSGELENLQSNEKAQLIEPIYEKYIDIKQRFESIQVKYNNTNIKLPLLEKNYADCKNKLTIITKELELHEESSTTQKKIFKKIHEIDNSIILMKKELDKQNKQFSIENENINIFKSDKISIDTKLKNINIEMEKVKNYLLKNQSDDKLLEEFQLIESKINIKNELKTKSNSIENQIEILKNKINTIKEKKNNIITKKINQEKQIVNIKNKIEQNEMDQENILDGKLLSDIRKENDDFSTVIPEFENLLLLLQKQTKETEKNSKILLEKKILIKKQSGIIKNIETLIEIRKDKDQIVNQLREIINQQNLIKSLSDKRNQLIQNQACPLCGSTEHPFVQNNIPIIDQNESELENAILEFELYSNKLLEKEKEKSFFKSKIEEKEQQHIELKKLLNQIDEQIKSKLETLQLDFSENIESQLILKINHDRKAKDKNTSLIKKIEKIQLVLTELETKKQNLEKELFKIRDTEKDIIFEQKKYELHKTNNYNEQNANEKLIEINSFELQKIISKYIKIEIEDFNELLLLLKNRKLLYQKKIKEQQQKYQLLSNYTNKQSVLSTKIEVSEELIKNLKFEIQETENKLESEKIKRFEKFEDKDPELEEKKLNLLSENLESNKRQKEQESNEIDKELSLLKQQFIDFKKESVETGQKLKEFQKIFNSSLKKNNFQSENEFLIYRVDEAKLINLRALNQSLLIEEATLKTSLESKKKELDKIPTKDLETLEYLNNQNKLTKAILDELKTKIGAIDQKIRDDEQKKQNQSELVKIFQQKQDIEEKWNKLYNLIGSSDGKKFRNFAQGLTFEIMINHANRQLQKMSDRYILLRDEFNPLELNVMDNYQAGIIRSTSTLSGGESFIVSLALALGLSNMASENVRIDSLFLDEGFGTLDENALETALETLHELHSEGKLIGIISHVPALKERIPVQLQIVQKSGGRSFIVGPGVE